MNLNFRGQLLDLGIHFYCRASFKKKDGKSPILLRLSYQGKRNDIYTAFSCYADNWDKENQRVIGESKYVCQLNRSLVDITYQVKDHFDELKYSRRTFSLDELVLRVKGQESPPDTIIEFSEKLLEEYETRIGVDLAITTFYKYKRTIKYLSEFLLSKKSWMKYPIANIDSDFLNQFLLFLRREKQQDQNSAVALMFCLKTILQKPIKSGVLPKNPFEDFKMKRKPVYRDCLDMDEINRLQKLENLTPAQQFKCDLFLFACFTGMAYADIHSLKGTDIYKDPDDTLYIRYNRQKTGVFGIVPLLPVAQNILKKYSPTDDCRDFQWKVMSNQKLNQGLKEIAQLAEIKKPLFMHLGRHTFATTVTLSHDIPIESVSKMLGHSSLKHTQIYAKIVDSKVKRNMKTIEHLFQ